MEHVPGFQGASVDTYRAIDGSTLPSDAALASPLSVVVLPVIMLPVINLSGEPEQAYFTDGLTAKLTFDLSRIPGAFVIASAMA